MSLESLFEFLEAWMEELREEVLKCPENPKVEISESGLYSCHDLDGKLALTVFFPYVRLIFEPGDWYDTSRAYTPPSDVTEIIKRFEDIGIKQARIFKAVEEVK